MRGFLSHRKDSLAHPGTWSHYTGREGTDGNIKKLAAANTDPV